MSPRLLRLLTMNGLHDPEAILSAPMRFIVSLDGCNPRARRWRASGCLGCWQLCDAAYLRMFWGEDQ